MSKILIIGTVPYSKNNQSRAFDTYFKSINSRNLAQIFSDPRKPEFGNCDKLYQITDVTVLKNSFRVNKKPGIKYDFKKCTEEQKKVNKLIKKRSIIALLYKLGKHKNSMNHLLRGLIWKTNNWLTKDLEEWVDDFNPDLIFIAFSDDFFILRIGLYFAKKYDIPIISAIGDDYYFNDKFSVNPFYHIYRKKYKKLVNQIMKYKSENIYISDKIRHKYDSFFKKNGETIQVSSDIERLPFVPVAKDIIKFFYAGNLRLGRYKSIIEISRVLETISNKYTIDIFSSEESKIIISRLTRQKNINFQGYRKYEDLNQKMLESDFSIIAEGKSKKDIITTRYSLSTKVADSIALGKPILVYGNDESGAIGFFTEHECALVSDNPTTLKNQLIEFIGSHQQQIDLYQKYKHISSTVFDKANNNQKFVNLVKKILEQ